MKDTFTKAAESMRCFGDSVRNIIDAHPNIFDETNETPDASQKPEPDFLCACNGKACGGICREKSGHFKDGGCTAAYRPLKPKAARRPRR
jgi:hypothetical protein